MFFFDLLMLYKQIRLLGWLERSWFTKEKPVKQIKGEEEEYKFHGFVLYM
jgi:hypothetical protein